MGSRTYFSVSQQLRSELSLKWGNTVYTFNRKEVAEANRNTDAKLSFKLSDFYTDDQTALLQLDKLLNKGKCDDDGEFVKKHLKNFKKNTQIQFFFRSEMETRWH